jgi:serine/threonine-protein kinase
MATESAAEEPNLLGQKLFGTYTITDKLGEGAMGTVYLAKQGQTGQRIAIKLLTAEAQRDQETVQRFLREARVISMLSHPNVVRVFIFGETSTGVSYMAMEYVDGIPLENIVRRQALPRERVIDITRQMLSAIAEAHDLGIMHRDLKPENVLLTEHRGRRDFVKILDFGIAKVQNANQQLTQSGVVYGTPAYMSPEQAQALDIDARADLYSLGCMMYEMATGELPFDAKTALKILEMQAFREPTPPSEVGDVDPRMEAIILKAMAKDADERYQSAREMLDALDALDEPETPPEPERPKADIPVTFQSLNRLAEEKDWFWAANFGAMGFLLLLTLILLIALAVS